MLLDRFHEAAAQADEATYFDAFSADGVFMGTDPKERWPLEEFRAWASPYFQRDSAWIFIPRERHVRVGDHGNTAWFDEVVESAHYGACRGTGVLRRVAGEWKIAHYNLTLPIPNELIDEVVRAMRGENALDRDPTLVLLVRHAEKVMDTSDPDPPLTPEGEQRARDLADMVRHLPVEAAYATQYARTQQTLEPACGSQAVPLTVTDAHELEELARALQEDHPGQCVLVSGHSNTLPALLQALGVKEEVDILPRQYDDLFLVLLGAGKAPYFLNLHYGSKSP